MIPDIFTHHALPWQWKQKPTCSFFRVMWCSACMVVSLIPLIGPFFNVYIDLTSYQHAVWTFSTRTMSGAGFLCRQISSTRWVTPAWSTKDRSCINSGINLQEGSVIGTVCIRWLLGLYFCGKMELILHFPLGFKFFYQIVSVPWNMNK